MDVRLPDGTVIRGVPDGMSKADLTAKLVKNGYDVGKLSQSAGTNSIPGGGLAGNRNAGKDDGPKDNLLGKIISPIDAGLSLGSSLIAGAVAPAAGFIKSAISGGDPERNASDIAQAMQRAPSTVTGAKLVNAAGLALSPLAALPSSAILDSTRAIGNGVQSMRGLAGPSAAAMAAQDAAAAQGTGTLADLIRRPAGAPPAPPILSTVGKVAAYPGNVAKAIVQPFTRAGQDNISGQIIQKFAQDGPLKLNAAEIVPGSAPTLAEATGNAGLARLQNATRDIAPNQFVTREKSNALARGNAFGEIAGDQGKLDYFRADRASVAKNLYDEAAKIDPTANLTPAVQEQISKLLERPSIKEATVKARKFAAERDEAPTEAGSLRGLHDTNTALDDMISKAVRDGEGGHAQALQNTKDQLVGVIETLSPPYKEARQTYQAMSQPVNQMETLQGLNIKDTKGNITLGGVQRSIDTLNKRMNKPGIDSAKSLTSDQINVLTALRDDLLRQSNNDLGRSAGSNTFQNIATDNIISAILPGRLGEAVKGKAGGILGQVGRLAYSGANDAIKAKLIEKMLDPKLAEKDLNALAKKLQDTNEPTRNRLATPPNQ